MLVFIHAQEEDIPAARTNQPEGSPLIAASVLINKKHKTQGQIDLRIHSSQTKNIKDEELRKNYRTQPQHL